MIRRALVGFLLLVASVIPVWGRQDGLVDLPVAPGGTHPRLLITRDFLNNTIRPRLQANPDLWASFRSYVDDETINNALLTHPESLIKSLVLAWLLTDDPNYYNNAISSLQRLVNWIEDSPVMTSPEGQWDTRFLEHVATLAIAYDWLYDSLSPDDRAILTDVLWRASQRLQNPFADNGRVWVPLDKDEYQFRALTSDDALWLWALTACALVLQGEHPQASLLIEDARQLWQTYALPALDIQPNGAWAAGPVEGFRAIWWKTQTALGWWTALGENYFDNTNWWYQRLGYHLFLRHPDGSYPAIIGSGAPHDPQVAAYGRAQALILSSIYQGSTYADWTTWWLNHTAPPPWMMVEELLWYNPDATATVPDSLTWRAFGTNHVFMRSNWTNSEINLDTSATYVSFHAGDHYAYPQFFDQGSFTIWYAGSDLLVRGGIYTDTPSFHDANYYGRTIGGNTVLICDLTETFDNIRPNPDPVWLNDCGQRPVTSGINHETWFANRDEHETANIERIYDDTNVTYIRADLSAAYSNTKVRSVMREVVFIRPHIVVVHDGIITPSQDFTAFNTLHFNTAPQLDGAVWSVATDHATLYIQQLAHGAQSQITEGYITAGQDTQPEGVSNGQGWYRMDTFPPFPINTPWFLTAFVAQDTNIPPPAPAIVVTGDSMRGAIVGNWQVMFDDDPLDISQATFSVGDVDYLLLTGLTPERSYTLQWANGSSERAFTHGAGTLLLTSPPAGAFVINR